VLPRVPSKAHPTLESLVTSGMGGDGWLVKNSDGRDSVIRMYNYADKKNVLCARASSGPLKLRIDVEHGGLPMSVCEVPCPWGRCAAGRDLLRGNVEFALDGEAMPHAALSDDKQPKNLHAMIEQHTCFIVAQAVTAGRHELSVTPKIKEGNYVFLSHVIHY
jgi:hypothetical protein